MFSEISRRVRYKSLRVIQSKGYFRSLWYPRYEFQMFPRQLCFLGSCLDQVKDIDGAIVEIGCSYGLTTTFLYEYMIESGFKRDYVCIDTFDGFTEEDISIEGDRGNKSSWLHKMFKGNHERWFKESLQRRSITDVEVIKADISELDPAELPMKIAFCLVDVDLYRPVKSALNKVYPRLSEGGIIVVDDCWSKSSPMFIDAIADAYQGALQAYREFTAEHGLPEQLVATKLAVINRVS